jgi:amino acid adenylation domain-containing protein
MTKNLISKLLHSAELHAESSALEIARNSWTYHQLFSAARQWKGYLAACREPLIGIYADKSFDCFTAILGTVLSGRGYVPLNPRFPFERNLDIIKTAKLETLLTGTAGLPFARQVSIEIPGCRAIQPGEMEAGHSEDQESPKQEDFDPGRTLYLLFTSGSTGKPKGVPVSESNLLAYLDYMLNTYDFSPDDRCSQTFDLTFDLSVHDMFITWLSGACLVVPVQPSPLHLGRYINQKNITVWFSVPSVARLMEGMRLLGNGSLPGLRYSLFCGEPLGKHLSKKWRRAAPGSRVVNLYGPTEATIAITSYELPGEGDPDAMNGIVSIGKPFSGQKYKLDPVNSTGEKGSGELLLGGSQVVESYFNDSEITQRAYKDKDGTRWYCTGDIATEDESGNLYFLGRIDQEIKHQGYRINLLEIDHTIRKFFRVDEVVTVYDESKGAGMIVSFITYPSRKGISRAKVMDTCKEKLPWYMVPEKVIFVEKMPVNLNGKIDRAALKKQIL